DRLRLAEASRLSQGARRSAMTNARTRRPSWPPRSVDAGRESTGGLRTTRQRVVVALNATTIHPAQERRDGAQRLRRTAPARAPHRIRTNEDAARVDGKGRNVGVEGFVVAVLEQILFDVRDVERADGGVAVPEVRGDGPDGLRSAEVARHGHDQI